MLQPSVRARRRVWLALALLGAAPSPAVAQTSHPTGKIAITTSSEAARADFVRNRGKPEPLALATRHGRK